MKVKAKSKGYYNAGLRYVGDIFEVEDGVTASWFEPVEAKSETQKAKSSKARGWVENLTDSKDVSDLA